jgi:hypothetical protein
MEREKQIEEMANAIEQARIKATDTTNSMNYGFGGWYAKELYAKGYVKASDVAEEIFAEIEKYIANLEYQANTQRKTVRVEELKAQCDWILHEVIPKALAELKKKYTESEKDNG